MGGIQIDKLLKNIYYKANNSGSFSGVQSLYRHVKEKKLPITFNQVKNWLYKQEVYTLHKPIKKRFKRNKVIVFGIDDTWQADLVDVQKLAKFNKGNKYLLTCIDLFSKYAWVVPLQDKSGKSIINAFSEIFKERIPKKIQTDKGKEFLNQNFKIFLKSKNVSLYQINTEMKACIVERFNRTLKEKMWRYFTSSKKSEYLKVLDKIVKSYNNSYHRSIKMKPSNVGIKNSDIVFKNLYGEMDQLIKFKFNIGDKVRIAKYKTIFDKGYTSNWTKEIFFISNRIPRYPPVYEIIDFNNEIIEGIFYESELQKTL